MVSEFYLTLGKCSKGNVEGKTLKVTKTISIKAERCKSCSQLKMFSRTFTLHLPKLSPIIPFMYFSFLKTVENFIQCSEFI